jgi:hypothetical protein
MPSQTDSAFSPSTRAYIGQRSRALLLKRSEILRPSRLERRVSPKSLGKQLKKNHYLCAACSCRNQGSVSGFQRCFVATGSRAPAASAVMLAAVTAGVPSASVRVPSAEIPAAVEALRRMPAASHVEAA